MSDIKERLLKARDVLRENNATLFDETNGKSLYGEAAAALAERDERIARPIDMVLHCPNCGHQHVDAPMTDDEYTTALFESSWWELGGEKPARWTNPPHRSHLCHNCGHVWRPADVATNGVQAVKTVGSADAPIADLRATIRERDERIASLEKERDGALAQMNRMCDLVESGRAERSRLTATIRERDERIASLEAEVDSLNDTPEGVRKIFNGSTLAMWSAYCDLKIELAAVREQMRAARKLIDELASGVSCDTLHHSAKERHGFDVDCPVMKRLRASIAALPPQQDKPA